MCNYVTRMERNFCPVKAGRVRADDSSRAKDMSSEIAALEAALRCKEEQLSLCHAQLTEVSHEASQSAAHVQE